MDNEKEGNEYESGNQGADKMVYGSEVWNVYPLGIVFNSGLRRVDDVGKGNDGGRVQEVF